MTQRSPERPRVFFTDVCRLLGRLVGSLWNVSVCFLWVCVGCLGDYSVACGMFRCAFMGVCRLFGRLADGLWNVSVCFLWVCVGCREDCFGFFIRWLRPILFYYLLFSSLCHSNMLLCNMFHSFVRGAWTCSDCCRCMLKGGRHRRFAIAIRVQYHRRVHPLGTKVTCSCWERQQHHCAPLL